MMMDKPRHKDVRTIMSTSMVALSGVGHLRTITPLLPCSVCYHCLARTLYTSDAMDLCRNNASVCLEIDFWQASRDKKVWFNIGCLVDGGL